MPTRLLTFKNNIYARFLLKLISLFLLVFILDFIIGGLLNRFYFTQESGNLFRTTYSFEHTSEDLLVFGSSTANHDYPSEIFQKRLKLSTYNVGRDGTSIFYDYALLQSILKRYSPKIIILNFDLDEFKKTSESYDRISSLLPYYRRHPEIRPIVELKSPYEKIKLFSKIYPYNSLFFSILAGNAEFNKKRRQDYQGYVPLTKIWGESLHSTKYKYQELDSNKIKIYKAFIHDCIAARVKLYVVCAPFFVNFENRSNSVMVGENIANEYRVKYFDFSGDPSILNKPSLFADMSHLNRKGAEIYSNKIIDKIINEESQEVSSQKR
jgi:hypothetical protein